MSFNVRPFLVVSVGCNNDALVTAINTKSVDPTNLASLGVVLPALGEEKQAPCSCHQQKAASPLARYKSDAILALVGKLVAEGYAEDKAIALAYATANGKPIKPRAKRQPVNVNKLLHDRIAQLDVEAIVKAAWEQHVTRGRV